MAKTAIVFGATGAIGQRLLPLLVASDTWAKIIAVTRRPLNTGSNKVSEVICDAQTIDDHAHALAGDTVFCCLGTTQKIAGSKARFREVDHDYILACAHITHRQGARHFLLVSAMGADARSLNFYSRVKGETERGLRAVGFERLDILRPSLLVGGRGESRPLEALGGIVMTLMSPAMVGPFQPYRPIKIEQVAQAMREIALREGAGTTVYPSDQLAAF